MANAHSCRTLQLWHDAVQQTNERIVNPNKQKTYEGKQWWYTLWGPRDPSEKYNKDNNTQKDPSFFHRSYSSSLAGRWGTWIHRLIVEPRDSNYRDILTLSGSERQTGPLHAAQNQYTTPPYHQNGICGHK